MDIKEITSSQILPANNRADTITLADIEKHIKDILYKTNIEGAEIFKNYSVIPGKKNIVLTLIECLEKFYKQFATSDVDSEKKEVITSAFKVIKLQLSMLDSLHFIPEEKKELITYAVFGCIFNDIKNFFN
jgi:hypothetical protein